MASRTGVLFMAAVVLTLTLCGCGGDLPLTDNEHDIQSDIIEKENSSGLQLVPDTGTYSNFG